MRRWRATVLRLLGAAGGGLALYASFPPVGQWYLAVAAFALLALVLHGRGARAGFGYGLIFGLAFLVPLLPWIGVFVGNLPWLALAAFESLFIALAGAAGAMVTRLPGWPFWLATVWVAAEAIRDRVPFGGFPWGDVAFSQAGGIFGPVAIVGGAPLLSFATVLCGTGLAGVLLALPVWRDRTNKAGESRPGAGIRAGTGITAVVAAAALLLPVLGGWAAGWLVSTAPEKGTATVAVIQGNVPRLGLDFNAQRRAVLDNHVRQTRKLVEQVEARARPQPDLVLWPENASDIDPYRNPVARAEIDRVTDEIGVPILVGAVVTPPGERPLNAAVLWRPDQGPSGKYIKRRLQPFGETMPMRSVMRHFSSFVDEASNYRPGDEATVFDMGPAEVGVATCYEVLFDSAVRDSVRNGATLLSVPSNNATFGRTPMTYQQLAISRERAIEHGRSLLVPTTSGVSAVVRPDGSVTQQSGIFTAETLVAEVPLRSSVTLATRLGAIPEWVLVGVAVASTAAGFIVRRRRADAGGSPGATRQIRDRKKASGDEPAFAPTR